MTWIKTTVSAVSAALLAALAIFAVANAARQKSNAQKWQQKADDIESGAMLEDLVTAEAASSRAKLHDAKAKELKKKAEARITAIGGQNEEIATIIDSWSK